MQGLFEKIMDGYEISREEALSLYGADLELLCEKADALRRRFCGDAFDLCAIANGKSGKCSEDCKFCAQSAHYRTEIDRYPLLGAQALYAAAADAAARGALRFAAVTSGRRLDAREVDALCEIYRTIGRGIGISLCSSNGLLSVEDFVKLKDAGVTRYHNNLETSRAYFPKICSTHRYDDKIAALKAARAAGLSLCSGGIVGMGESWEDRIDLALELRALGVRSVPVNFLAPIPGTPFAGREPIAPDEAARTVAIFRFILPKSALRLAGGRGLFADRGERLFRSGANAAISNNMLTTDGISIETDLQMLKRLGYRTAKAE